MVVELRNGQYQLGSVRFGRFTQLPIESMEVTGYGVNSTDYQIPRADEMRFGIDTFQPGTLNFTIGILDNYILPNMVGATGISSAPGLQNAIEQLEALHKEWRADDIRKQFGYVKPLFVCRQGETVRVYGRPRKFAHNTASMKANHRKAVCEFQRVDTICYSETQYSVVADPSAEGTTTQNAVRSGGGVDTWVQILITGPINHPKIKIGSLNLIDVNYNLAAGKVLEINTYPWTRRVMDSDGLNVAPLLIGTSPYLDEIVIPPSASTEVGFSGSSTTAATKMAVLWREAYSSL